MQWHDWKISWGQAVLQDEQDGEMWEVIEKVGWGRLSLFWDRFLEGAEGRDGMIWYPFKGFSWLLDLLTLRAVVKAQMPGKKLSSSSAYSE